MICEISFYILRGNRLNAVQNIMINGIRWKNLLVQIGSNPQNYDQEYDVDAKIPARPQLK